MNYLVFIDVTSLKFDYFESTIGFDVNRDINGCKTMTEQKNKKKSGKRAEPIRQELEFIYERLPKLSDKAIVDDIRGETSFPERSIGFIKRRRREYEVAEKVIMQRNEGAHDIDVVKHQKKHWERLADRSQEILDHLKTYSPYVDNSPIIEYLVEEKDFAIISLLSDYRSNCLLTHLRNEHSQFSTLPSWGDLVIRNIGDWDLIRILGSKAEKGVFAGKCDACKDWD